MAAEYEINTGLLKNRFSDEITLDKASVNTESRYVTLYFTADMKWLEAMDEYKLEILNRFYLNYLVQLKLSLIHISEPTRPY